MEKYSPETRKQILEIRKVMGSRDKKYCLDSLRATHVFLWWEFDYDLRNEIVLPFLDYNFISVFSAISALMRKKRHVFIPKTDLTYLRQISRLRARPSNWVEKAI